MIKIIKEGTRDIRECESCGCLFSFDAEDISVDQRIKRYIKCPQCENKIILEQIKTYVNCSNCEHVNDIEYREKCNECGSENFFKYWKGEIK